MRFLRVERAAQPRSPAAEPRERGPTLRVGQPVVRRCLGEIAKRERLLRRLDADVDDLPLHPFRAQVRADDHDAHVVVVGVDPRAERGGGSVAERGEHRAILSRGQGAQALRGGAQRLDLALRGERVIDGDDRRPHGVLRVHERDVGRGVRVSVAAGSAVLAFQ